jgi:hypothetical protein
MMTMGRLVASARRSTAAGSRTKSARGTDVGVFLPLLLLAMVIPLGALYGQLAHSAMRLAQDLAAETNRQARNRARRIHQSDVLQNG